MFSTLTLIPIEFNEQERFYINHEQELHERAAVLSGHKSFATVQVSDLSSSEDVAKELSCLLIIW